MVEPPATAGLQSHPGSQDQGLAGTPNIAALLLLVHKLLAIGKELMVNLQRPDTGLSRSRLLLRFGTDKVQLILAQIIRALHRAAALEQRLLERAATGRDLVRFSARPPVPHPGTTRRRSAPHSPAEFQQEGALTPAELERIVKEARHRPVGTVIADICGELGLKAGNIDGQLLDELADAIRNHGGSLARWDAAILRHAREAGREMIRQLAAVTGVEPVTVAEPDSPPLREMPPEVTAVVVSPEAHCVLPELTGASPREPVRALPGLWQVPLAEMVLPLPDPVPPTGPP